MKIFLFGSALGIKAIKSDRSLANAHCENFIPPRAIELLVFICSIGSIFKGGDKIC